MKRFLLLISAMLVMSSMMAQDIYTSGFYTNDNGKKAAAVYKNGTRLYMLGGSSSTIQYESTAVVVNGSDIYWSVNRINEDNSLGYADVYKNTEYFLNSPTQGRRINDMFIYFNGNHLYTFGLQTFDGVQKAVIWKDSTTDPYMTFGTDTYNSEATCGTPYLNEGAYFVAGGYQYTSASDYHGVIWYSRTPNTPLYTFPENTKIYDVVYYDNALYSIGTAVVDGTTKVRVWKNTSPLYTYDENSTRLSLFIDGGAVFATIGGGSDKVYKNDTELYSTGGFFNQVIVNTKGVYVCGGVSSKATVWKDNTVLYTFDNTTSRHLAMYIDATTCTDEDVRTLPYTENFEIGVTDWDCWTKIDSDNTPEDASQHWLRAAEGGLVGACPGDYCARHGYNGTEQTGWLVTPRLFLQPGRDNTTLSFDSWAAVNSNKSVWVSTNSNPASTSSYQQVWSHSGSHNGWATINVDLSDYQGQLIYIAFKYESNASSDASWLVDNVSVTEDFEDPGVSSMPYIENFTSSNEPGWIWYIIDNDHTGENKCWQHNNSETSAYHPWGQNNGIKQEGWMFSPDINLPVNHNVTLTFKNKNSSSGSDMKNSVWIAVDEDGLPDPAHYTKIWEQTGSYPSNWTTVTVDLSAYAGHTVDIGFKYEGTYAHAWYIDDVEVSGVNLGVDEIDANVLSIYPNPTKESIRINGLEQEVEVNIYNVTGSLVKTVVTNGQSEINVSELPAGLYMARFGETTLRFTKE